MKSSSSCRRQFQRFSVRVLAYPSSPERENPLPLIVSVVPPYRLPLLGDSSNMAAFTVPSSAVAPHAAAAASSTTPSLSMAQRCGSGACTQTLCSGLLYLSSSLPRSELSRPQALLTFLGSQKVRKVRTMRCEIVPWRRFLEYKSLHCSRRGNFNSRSKQSPIQPSICWVP